MVSTYRRQTYRIWLGLAFLIPSVWLASLLIANQATFSEPLPSWEDKVLLAYDRTHGKPADESLVTMGAMQACAELGSYPDLGATWQRLVDNGYGSDESATIISAATVWLCPEFSYLFDD